jgi:hypothetical protein
MGASTRHPAGSSSSIPARNVSSSSGSSSSPLKWLTSRVAAVPTSKNTSRLPLARWRPAVRVAVVMAFSPVPTKK